MCHRPEPDESVQSGQRYCLQCKVRWAWFLVTHISQFSSTLIIKPFLLLLFHNVDNLLTCRRWFLIVGALTKAQCTVENWTELATIRQWNLRSLQVVHYWRHTLMNGPVDHWTKTSNEARRRVTAVASSWLSRNLQWLSLVVTAHLRFNEHPVELSWVELSWVFCCSLGFNVRLACDSQSLELSLSVRCFADCICVAVIFPIFT